MGRHRLTSPMSSSARLILRPGDGYTPPPHHRWLSVVHGCPPSAMGLPCCRCSYLEQSASTCHVHTLYVCFPRTLEGFSFQAFLYMTRYLKFCSACSVTVLIFGHLNRSFYLLTYLLTDLLTYPTSRHWLWADKTTIDIQAQWEVGCQLLWSTNILDLILLSSSLAFTCCAILDMLNRFHPRQGSRRANLQLDSTRYSAWPSPQRLVRRACSLSSAESDTRAVAAGHCGVQSRLGREIHGHTDTQTPSTTIPSPLVEQRGEGKNGVSLCQSSETAMLPIINN